MIMSLPSKRVSLALLSIIIPVSLLAAFRVTGVLPEPPKRETITAEPVSWQMDRPILDPSRSLAIDEAIRNGYSNNDTTMSIDVRLYHYLEDWGEIPFGKHDDGITFKVNITATVAEGLNASFTVKFHTVDSYSTIFVSGPHESLFVYNTSVTEMRLVSREWTSEGWHNLGEAYVKAESTGSRCTLRTQIAWVFNDLNAEDHQLEVSLEFTYFNQTTTQKIVVPTILDMPISTEHGAEP
jgi:hypothetical protein